MEKKKKTSTTRKNTNSRSTKKKTNTSKTTRTKKQNTTSKSKTLKTDEIKKTTRKRTVTTKNEPIKKIEKKQESLEEIMKRVDEISEQRKKLKSTKPSSKPKQNITRSEKNKNILEKDKYNDILEKVNKNENKPDLDKILKKAENKTKIITKSTPKEKQKEDNKTKTLEVKTEEKVTEKSDKKTKRKVIILVTYAILICTLIYTGYKCINWLSDNKKIEKQVEKINKIVEIEEINDEENIEVIEQPEQSKTGQYWNYLNMKLINVNFSELKKQNSDTVGWIQVNGTNINYPFVQTANNDYYLTHAFDKTYNDAGWVFLDYRNNIKDLNRNTIIYAHSRLDSSMFGTLKNVLKTNWVNNPDNFIIKLSMESENTMWQVFSVYHIPTTSDYLQIDFYSNNEFLEFGNMLLNRSAYNFNTSISENDKILTLSTCYSDTEKTVLHAKLIKREVKNQ